MQRVKVIVRFGGLTFGEAAPAVWRMLAAIRRALSLFSRSVAECAELSELSRTIAEQSAGVRTASAKRQIMTAFNAVRFKVKAGREQQFLDAHNKVAFAWPGLRHVNIIKTGEHTFCVIAEWTDMDAIVNARDRMIATLNSFRDTLEDLGGGLGVTDPVSGPVVKTLE